MPIKNKAEWKAAWQEIVEKAGKKGILWTLRNLVNLIDDYPDWLKEKIHGAHLPFGLEINISVLMANRHPHTWDLIRKQGDYPNSDPEDLEGTG
jgi:hypothetical protein